MQIQEEVLNEIHRSQESAYNLRDAARQHFLQRAKISSKILKYPHIEDYTVCPNMCFFVLRSLTITGMQWALLEHDEKQLYTARQNLYDIRNVYAILTDIVHKNINKVNDFPFINPYKADGNR